MNPNTFLRKEIFHTVSCLFNTSAPGKIPLIGREEALSGKTAEKIPPCSLYLITLLPDILHPGRKAIPSKPKTITQTIISF